MKILFASLHPEYETFGCGGTILRHKDIGYKISYSSLIKV